MQLTLIKLKSQFYIATFSMQSKGVAFSWEGAAAAALQGNKHIINLHFWERCFLALMTSPTLTMIIIFSVHNSLYKFISKVHIERSKMSSTKGKPPITSTGGSGKTDNSSGSGKKNTVIKNSTESHKTMFDMLFPANASTSTNTTKKDPYQNMWSTDVFRDYPSQPPKTSRNTSNTSSNGRSTPNKYNRSIYRSCTFG